MKLTELYTAKEKLAIALSERFDRVTTFSLYANAFSEQHATTDLSVNFNMQIRQGDGFYSLHVEIRGTAYCGLEGLGSAHLHGMEAKVILFDCENKEDSITQTVFNVSEQARDHSLAEMVLCAVAYRINQIAMGLPTA
jgi:hypothetical protein